MRAAVLALLLATGCEDGLLVVHATVLDDASGLEVAQAAYFFGATLELHPGLGSPPGVVVVELTDVPVNDTDGRAIRWDDCHAYARGLRDTWSLTHELGHLYGLDHVDTPGNLMHPDLVQVGQDPEITDEQLDTARHGIRQMDLCR